jgi:hypothetical protein
MMPEQPEQNIATETPPSLEVTSWNKVRHLVALGYWLTKVTPVTPCVGTNKRRRYSYVFRKHPAELSEIMASYHAGTLMISACAYDKAETELVAIQRSIVDGPWIDPESEQ